LNWNMAEESNKTIYRVEYSNDGKNFYVIGILLSKVITEHGDDYQFIHTAPGNGINYYRLKMNEGSGKPMYSAIRKIFIGKNKLNMGVYPNPANGSVTMQLDVNDGASLQVKLFDVMGRLVKQNNLKVKNQLAEMKLGGLHNGIYWIVAALSTGDVYKCKLVIAQ